MDVVDAGNLGGQGVRRAANRLTRFFQVEANTMRVLGGWTPRTRVSELRVRWGRHVGEDARRAGVLRARLSRLRTTPEMIHVPVESFREIFERTNEAETEAQMLAALYLAVKPRLRDAYLRHLSEIDPTGDELSAQVLAPAVVELDAQISWGEQVLESIIAGDDALKHAALDFARFVGELIDEAGGFLPDSEVVPEERSGAEAANGTGFWPMRRAPSATMKLGAEFRIARAGEEVSHCPKYEEFGDPVKQLMLVHHGLMPEHASLAICGNILYEFQDMPWEFYADFATQTSDEERHIALLLRRLEELGGTPASFAFPEWTFYDLLAGLPLGERVGVFNAVVEGDVVENLHERIQIMRGVGDHRTAHVMDWICADESLHMLNGMRWLAYLYGDDEESLDRALDHGQEVLAGLLARVRSSEKSYDSAAEVSVEERRRVLQERRRAAGFYHRRTAPVAPIARTLGGFRPRQIERLTELADGKTTRL